MLFGAFSAWIALIFIFTRTLRMRDSARGVGCLGLLLILLPGIILVGALLMLIGLARLEVWAAALTLMTGGLFTVGGLIFARRESRLRRYPMQRAYSVPQIGVGLLLLIAGSLLPTLPAQFVQSNEGSRPTPTVAAFLPTPKPTRTPQFTATPTLSPTPSRTPSPIPTLTLTPTATLEDGTVVRPDAETLVIAETTSSTPSTVTPPRTPTPTGSPSFKVVCTATALYNVNMRAEPSLAAQRLTTIPYTSSIDLAGKSADGDWWYARYENQRGWILGQYIRLERACENAPTIAAR